jgi:hypothetical protein
VDFWIPYVAFVAIGILTVAAEHLYYQALRERGLGIRDDNEVAAEIRSAPGRLPWVVAVETGHRLRALATRQPDSSLERKRLLACVAIALSIGALVWVAVF